MLQLNRLTLGEIAKLEEIAGASLTSFADDTAPKGRLLIAAAYIVHRRSDPSFTINQAEALTMDEVNAILAATPHPVAADAVGYPAPGELLTPGESLGVTIAPVVAPAI